MLARADGQVGLEQWIDGAAAIQLARAEQHEKLSWTSLVFFLVLHTSICQRLFAAFTSFTGGSCLQLILALLLGPHNVVQAALIYST